MKTATWRDEIDADTIEVARYIKESCARLAKPEQWMQNAMGRDENGKEVSIRDTEPTSYCMQGAFLRTYVEWSEFRDMDKEELDRVSDTALEILFDALPDDFSYYSYKSIPNFNDAWLTTHADVLRVLDFSETIASAEAWGMV